MAGDHKCPVCQATFTRPQHVARHMRSHTGDRPYKCQHCGDQFARSDLLSRHINKCHASEKPPTTTAPNRRKGQSGPSANRAATSKQACDQCVLSTLPCDGSKPCAKCVNRKMDCTYVKFQRQTAPSGPGHKHSQSLDSRLGPNVFAGASVPRAEDLFLGPPPTSIPSMMIPLSGDLIYPGALSHHQHHPFTFAHPQPWDGASIDSPNLSLQSAPGTSSSAESSPRYPHQLLGQQPSGQQGAASNAAHSDVYRQYALPNIYPGPGPNQGQEPSSSHHHHQQDLFVGGSGGAGAVHPPHSHHPTMDDLHILSHAAQQQQGQYQSSGVQPSYAGHRLVGLDPAAAAAAGLYPTSVYGNRRVSIDQYSDDTSSHSQPNSASSSSVHLPLPDGAEGGPSDSQHQQHVQHQQHQSGYDLDFDPYGQPPPPSRDGPFSSAFGLMSLDDPNVLAGVAPDGLPFFSNAALKLPPQDSTPRPFRDDNTIGINWAYNVNNANSSGGSGGTTNSHHGVTTPRDREAEMKELRDFWKQYLRTPLTGPSLGATPKVENGGQLTSSSSNNTNNNARPSPKRTLSRVLSLPSVRTPSDEKLPPHAKLHHPNGHNSHHPTPTVHHVDDLRSYEQAVLARKAPTNLNIAPRKSKMGSGHVKQSSTSPQPTSSTLGPTQQQQSSRQHDGQQQDMRSHPQGQVQIVTTGASPEDKASPSSQSHQSPSRPSFKRLPSQTLEPASSKRTHFLPWNHELITNDLFEDTDSDVDQQGGLHPNGYLAQLSNSASDSDGFIGSGPGPGQHPNAYARPPPSRLHQHYHEQQEQQPHSSSREQTHDAPADTYAHGQQRGLLPIHPSQSPSDRFRRYSLPGSTRTAVPNEGPVADSSHPAPQQNQNQVSNVPRPTQEPGMIVLH